MNTKLRKLLLVPVLTRALALALLMLAGPAHALLDIEITSGVEGEIPMAIVPFKWNGTGAAPTTSVAAIIKADLYRTGLFKFTKQKDFIERPHHGGEVNFRNWQVLGVESLVVGSVTPDGKGGYVIQFQLFDIYSKARAQQPGIPEYKIKQLAGHRLHVSAKKLRQAAHRISDIVYRKLTGKRGAFSQRIAYVTKIQVPGKGARYALRIADSDGHAPFTVHSSPDPIMSPAWSPDGKSMAYVSFENGKSAIYVQQLVTAKRRLLSSHKGINGAPAWSPDGRTLAVTLSHQGNPEIYLIDTITRQLRRLTNNTAIDTEPAFSPDGKFILFTSDRSGRPQVYRVPVKGGRAQRQTFEGKYNTSASYSPDAKSVLMIHHDGTGFRVAVMDLSNSQIKVLTRGRLDESPAWAPNGSMVIYASEYQGRGVLYVVSADGRVSQRLLLQTGDVREPVWEPFTKQ
jgi:TolB protein